MLRTKLFATLAMNMLLFVVLPVSSQPVNDNPCGAISLTIQETADDCTPTIYDMNGPTYLNLSLPDAGTCPGPVTLPSYPDYWFKFTAIGSMANLNFQPENGTTTGGGIFGTGANYFVVYKASNCNGPFTLAFSCGRTDVAYTRQLTGLQPGDEYYVRVVSALPNVALVHFGICVSTNFPPTSARVGINTKAPQSNLDVAGNAVFRNTVTLNENPVLLKPLSMGSSLGSRIALWGAASGPHYGLGIQSGLLQVYTDISNSNIAFGYGSSNSFSERARIINAGEIGMQVNGRLQLKNGTANPALGAGIWLFKPDNSGSMGFMGVQNASNIGFYGGSRGWGVMYSTVNSNLGIGNDNPTRPLSFPAELGEKILLYPGVNGEVGIGVYGNELRLHSDNPGAKVSFGTQDNVGNFTEVGKFEKNGAYGLSVFGSIWANGTTYASDGRFKKNISPLENSLEKILQLQGVSYQMNTEAFPSENFDNSQQVGLVAQEVEKIVPEVVSTGPSGYKAIDYAKLVPLLIESIKAQQEKIKALEKKIEELSKRYHR